MKKYFNLVANDDTTDIYIYGDITSWEWLESDVSSYTLSKQLEDVTTDKINVYINSYGGEVAEGLAIYNALVRHPAEVTTYCDGFACSISSVIFMAGEKRIMADSSLLMIHYPWTRASGNASDFRKQADDLDIISDQTVKAYMKKINISEEELKALLAAESWITPEKALEMDFVTAVSEPVAVDKVSQSALAVMVKQLANKQTPEMTVDIKLLDIPEVATALNQLTARIESLEKTNKPQEALKRGFFNFKED